MKEILRRFERLTAQEILALAPGTYSDYEMLEVLEHFNQEDDEERSMAALELTLRSPEHDELVLYNNLYQDLIEDYRFLGDYSKARSWAYVNLAYDARHSPQNFWSLGLRVLADEHLYREDLNTGLGLYTRWLKAAPEDIWAYNALGLILPDCGLNSLAVKALECGLKFSDHPGFEELDDQLEEMHQSLKEEMENGELSSSPVARGGGGAGIE